MNPSQQASPSKDEEEQELSQYSYSDHIQPPSPQSRYSQSREGEYSQSLNQNSTLSSHPSISRQNQLQSISSLARHVATHTLHDRPQYESGSYRDGGNGANEDEVNQIDPDQLRQTESHFYDARTKPPSRAQIEEAEGTAAAMCDLPHVDGAGCIKCTGIVSGLLRGIPAKQIEAQEFPTVPYPKDVLVDPQTGNIEKCNSCAAGLAQHKVITGEGATGPNAVPDVQQLCTCPEKEYRARKFEQAEESRREQTASAFSKHEPSFSSPSTSSHSSELQTRIRRPELAICVGFGPLLQQPVPMPPPAINPVTNKEEE